MPRGVAILIRPNISPSVHTEILTLLSNRGKQGYCHEERNSLTLSLNKRYLYNRRGRVWVATKKERQKWTAICGASPVHREQLYTFKIGEQGGGQRKSLSLWSLS